MEQAYAQALWKMINNGTEPSRAVHSLRENLKLHGRNSLIPRIAKAFERIAERETQRGQMTLTVAKEHDAGAAKHEATKLAAKMGFNTDDIKTNIDESLIGGWRLEGREHLVDASFKKHLLSIYNAATR